MLKNEKWTEAWYEIHHTSRKSFKRVVRLFSAMSIWFCKSPRSVVSARSIFHERFSISASNWACWYSNWKISTYSQNVKQFTTFIQNKHFFTLEWNLLFTTINADSLPNLSHRGKGLVPAHYGPCLAFLWRYTPILFNLQH